MLPALLADACLHSTWRSQGCAARRSFLSMHALHGRHRHALCHALTVRATCDGCQGACHAVPRCAMPRHAAPRCASRFHNVRCPEIELSEGEEAEDLRSKASQARSLAPLHRCIDCRAFGLQLTPRALSYLPHTGRPWVPPAEILRCCRLLLRGALVTRLSLPAPARPTKSPLTPTTNQPTNQPATPPPPPTPTPTGPRSWSSTAPSARCPTLCWERTRWSSQTSSACARWRASRGPAGWSWSAGKLVALMLRRPCAKGWRCASRRSGVGRPWHSGAWRPRGRDQKGAGQQNGPSCRPRPACSSQGRDVGHSGRPAPGCEPPRACPLPRTALHCRVADTYPSQMLEVRRLHCRRGALPGFL